MNVDSSVQRLIRLMHRDFTYHRDALAAGGLKTAHIDERIVDLESRSANLSIPTSPKDKPPGYEKLVRKAAVATKSDEGRWAYLWSAASGAAHGQNWFGIESSDLLALDEYEPGFYRTLAFPDPAFVTDTVGAACLALEWGTLRWLINGGHDPYLIRQAAHEIFALMPKRT